MSIKDGGPAYPTDGGCGSFGMSLRDHFAGLAMQGIIATIAGSGVVIRRDNEPDEQLAVPRHGDLIAQYSYQMADAMLAAREQRT